MRTIACVLSCLASAAHGRRVHIASHGKLAAVHQHLLNSPQADPASPRSHTLFASKRLHRRIKTCKVLKRLTASLLEVSHPIFSWHRTSYARLPRDIHDRSISLEMLHSSDTPARYAPPRNAYIHIPFCRRRCFYCDFPIQVVGDKENAADSVAEKYVALLEHEIADTAAKYGPECEASGGLQTIYFGGGTPSLMPPLLLCRIIQNMSNSFGLSPTAEVTLEMDPGTFDRDKLESFIKCGVNRISLGVQSLHESLLAGAGRVHTVEDVFEAVRIVKGAGIENWSLDLISGLPHETMEQWQQTLHMVLSELQPPHISIYDLQVEAGTAFGKWFSPGMAPLPDDDETAEMYKHASRTLTASGYQHYEVSSYALPGFRSQHNSGYWKMKPFLGMGLGASSYLGGLRFARPRDMKSYEKWAHSIDYGVEDAEQDELDLLLDEIMVALRTSDGLDLVDVAQRHGDHTVQTIRDAVQKMQANGLAIISNAGTNLRLSAPDGFLVSNDIISTIFARLLPD